MKHFENIHLSKIEQLFNKKLCITLKIDGTALQVTNDNSNLTFRKRSGNTFKIGPEIDDKTTLLTNEYDKSIEYLKSKKEILLQYDMVVFEIVNNTHSIKYNNIDSIHNLVLIGFKYKNTEYCSTHELESLAKKLNVGTIPFIYNGIFDNNVLYNYLVPLLNKNDLSTYVSYIFNLNTESISLWSNNIEGIVLNIGNEQYKIIDNKFRASIKKNNIYKNIRQSYITYLTEYLYKNYSILDAYMYTLKDVSKMFFQIIKDDEFIKKSKDILLNFESPIILNKKKLKNILSEKEINILHNSFYKVIYILFISILFKEPKRNIIINNINYKDKIIYIINRLKGIQHIEKRKFSL